MQTPMQIQETFRTFRTFIAIDLTAEIKEKIGKIQKELPSDGIRLVDPEIIHLTLKFLGDINEEKIRQIKEVLSDIQFENFKAECKGVGVFPNEKYIKVIWAGIEKGSSELKTIANKIEEDLSQLGFSKDRFSPHLTIARVRKEIKIDNFLKKYKNESFGIFTVSSRDIKLKKSTLTPKGPIYEDL